MNSNSLSGESFLTPEKKPERLLVVARATTDVQMQVPIKIGNNYYSPFLIHFSEGNDARRNVVDLFELLQTQVGGYTYPAQKIPVTSFDTSIENIMKGETQTLSFRVVFESLDGEEKSIETTIGTIRNFGDPDEIIKLKEELSKQGYSNEQIENDITNDNLNELGLQGIRTNDSVEPYDVLFFCTRGGGTHHVISTLSTFENKLDYHKKQYPDSLLKWNAENIMFNFVPHITFAVPQSDGTVKEMPFMLRVGKHRNKINVEQINLDAQNEVAKIIENNYGSILVSGTVSSNPREEELFKSEGNLKLLLQPTIHAVNKQEIVEQLGKSAFTSFNESELVKIAEHCNISDTNEYDTVHEKYGNILFDIQKKIGGGDNSIRVCTLGADGAILLHTQNEIQQLYGITSRMGEEEQEKKFIDPIINALGHCKHILSMENTNTIGCGDTAFAAAIMTDHPFYKEMRDKRYTYLQGKKPSPEKMRDCEMIIKLIWIKILSGIVYRTQYTHIPNWSIHFKNGNTEKFKDVIDAIYDSGVLLFEDISKRYFSGETNLHFAEKERNYGVFKM